MEDFLEGIAKQKSQGPGPAAVPAAPGGQPVPASAGPACDKTMTEAVEEYLVMYKPTVGYSTYRAEASFASLVKERAGGMRLADFGYNAFQTLLNELVTMKDGSPRAEKSLRGIRIFIKNVLKHARRNCWISAEDFELATDGIRIPKSAREYDKNERFLEYEELAAILKILEGSRRYYLIVRILVLTGMRGQELFALEKRDLVREKNYINVRQALVEQEKKRPGERSFVIGATKTLGSVRKVPAVDEVFRYFDELEQMTAESGARARAAELGNRELVFVDGRGQVVDKRALVRNLSNYIKARDPEKKLGLHSMRHCFISYLERQKVEMRYVELAVGHVLQGVGEKYYVASSDTYLEVLLPEIRKVQQKIDEALQRA